MEDDHLCEYLEWDSAFFGRRIARLNARTIDQRILDRVLAWCRKHDIDCLYLLADSADDRTARLADDHGFRLTDTRVTLERSLEEDTRRPEMVGGVVRPYRPEDLPLLLAIAGTSHRQSRFYNDPRFPDQLCGRLYEIWIEKSCNGYADVVLVASDAGTPAGYIACRLLDRSRGQIDLFAIAEQSRGKGLGLELLNQATSWFASQGAKRVTVVTQGRQEQARRLYERGGFVTCSIQHWYHWWSSAVEDGAGH